MPTGISSTGNRVSGTLAYSGGTSTATAMGASPVASQWYSGNGSSPPWPAYSEWRPWLEMWEINEPYIGKECAVNSYTSPPVPNTQEETQTIREAIEYYSNASSIDPRLIFVTVMAASQGCVRAVATVGDVRNPGLMGSHNGSGDCYPTPDRQLTPCPDQQIYQMIYDGTQSDLGNTLVDVFNQRQSSGAPKAFYEGWRLYNSGTDFVIDGELSTDSYVDVQGQQRHSGDAHYVSNSVNRLRGWNGVS